MKKYVVGFIFTPEYEHILLIRKNRPYWQEGFLNGVGGHIEEGESAYEAMVRECKEESNLSLHNWLSIGCITDDKHYHVECYYTMVSSFDNAKPLTDESLEIISMDELDYDQLVHPADVFIRLAMNPSFHGIKLTER